MLSMSEPRILHLNLVRKFFDQIAKGEKREEYRDRAAASYRFLALQPRGGTICQWKAIRNRVEQ
jgi:hypothetical protein